MDLEELQRDEMKIERRILSVIGLGTLINVGSVVFGSTLGLWLGTRLTEKVQSTVMQGIGVVTLIIAVQMALKTQNVLILLISILLGGLLGVWWHVDEGIERLGRKVEERFLRLTKSHSSCSELMETEQTSMRRTSPLIERTSSFLQRLSKQLASSSSAMRAASSSVPHSFLSSPVQLNSGQRRASSSVAEGFITASLVFCVGPLTFLGAIQDGLSGDFQLLAVKSVLDGFTSLAFAATLGVGVLFSALTVLVVQGMVTLFAGFFQSVLNDAMMAEMTAAGGVMVLMLGLVILKVKTFPVTNYLPALILAPVIVFILQLL